MKPKNKDHANFYERCDLTQKVYLPHAPLSVTSMKCMQQSISHAKAMRHEIMWRKFGQGQRFDYW